MRILVINGPNLNMLGKREPDIYGNLSYEALVSEIENFASERGAIVEIRQSNHEGDIIDWIQQFTCDGIIINPGAFTHYSFAIHDALKSIAIPSIEVHLSNIHTREEFRRKSITAPACVGQICGLGFTGYLLAIDYLLRNNR
jgi:3-dehydroquinate dehydratase-2